MLRIEWLVGNEKAFGFVCLFLGYWSSGYRYGMTWSLVWLRILEKFVFEHPLFSSTLFPLALFCFDFDFENTEETRDSIMQYRANRTTYTHRKNQNQNQPDRRYK